MHHSSTLQSLLDPPFWNWFIACEFSFFVLEALLPCLLAWPADLLFRKCLAEKEATPGRSDGVCSLAERNAMKGLYLCLTLFPSSGIRASKQPWATESQHSFVCIPKDKLLCLFWRSFKKKHHILAFQTQSTLQWRTWRKSIIVGHWVTTSSSSSSSHLPAAKPF